jgi:hypothetical protein
MLTPIKSERANEVPVNKNVAGNRSTIAWTTVSEFDVE